MLLTLGKISKGDFGEESLVSRFLLALVLNEYSVVNQPDGKAFCEFGKKCLGLELNPEDMERATATVEFKPKRCKIKCDDTKLDAMFTLKTDWLWGIEAKYYDRLRIGQSNREAVVIRELAKNLKYGNVGLLFIVPEQQLESIEQKRYEVRRCISELIKAKDIDVRLVSWEIIFDILIHTGPPEIEKELIDYCELRNKNSDYPEKLSTKPKVEDWYEWEKKITLEGNKLDRNKQIRKHKSSFKSSLVGMNKEIFSELVRRARTMGFGKEVDIGTYINFYCPSNKTVAFQIHRNIFTGNVVLAIPDINDGGPEEEPTCPILDFEEISGHIGNNKPWLNGYSRNRWPYKPVKLFGLPESMADSFNSEAWDKVKELLGYALDQCRKRNRKEWKWQRE